MTFADRVLAMALALGYGPPTYITEHAIQRWGERWNHAGLDRGAHVEVLRQQLAFAEIEGIAHKERATIWRLKCDAKIVVAPNGHVMTVLPPGAERTNRRPVKKRQRPPGPRRRRR